MKALKFIIGLQVFFLIGIVMFSAGIVCHSKEHAPSAITNLAARQPGYEIASPKAHEEYQYSYAGLDSLKKAADAIIKGEVPDNVKVINESNKENPVYLVSFLCTSKEGKDLQFFYIMAPKDPEIEGIEKNKDLSEALEVFIAPSLTQPIENLSADTQKMSSAGMIKELRILVGQMKKAEMPQGRIDAAYAIAAKGPAAYPALPAIYELLVSEDTSIHRDAAFIITTMGPIALPFLNEKLKTTIGEQAKIIKDIIENIAPISKASSAGTIEDLPILIKQLEDKDPSIRKNALCAIRNMRPVPYEAFDVLLKLLNEKDLFLRRNAAYAIAEIAEMNPHAAYSALNTMVNLLGNEDYFISGNAMLTIARIGHIALPFLNEKLKTTIGEQAAVIRGIIENIAPVGTNQMDQLTIELENVKLGLKTLQDKLAIAKIDQGQAYVALANAAKISNKMIDAKANSDYEKVSAEVARLEKAVNAAETKIVNIQNTMTTLTALTIKASSAGTDQINAIAEQLEEVALELEILRNELVIEKNVMDNAAELSDTYNKAAAKANEIQIAIETAELRFDNLQKIRNDLISKAYSAGMNQPDQLVTKLKAALLELQTLQDELVTARNRMANETVPNASYKAAIEVITLGKKIADIKNTITTLSRSASKASSAGTDYVYANQLVIEIESVESKLKKLQNELVTAKKAQDSAFKTSLHTVTGEKGAVDYKEATSEVMKLEDEINLVKSKLADLENDMKKLTDVLINKTSSTSADYQLNSLAQQLEAAELKLETLENQIVATRDKKNSASPDTYNKAAVEVMDLIKEINLTHSEISDIKNTMTTLTTSTGKASSAGYQKDIADTMMYLSGVTDAFTDVNTIPELNIDMLSKQIEAYKNAIDKLENIKNQSPDAAIAVAEHFNRAEISLNTMTAARNIAAEDAALENVTGTIVINDNDIPDNQQILLTMLDKANPYLEALETKLGCKVRLLSQYNPKLDGAADMIAISSMSVDGISRRVDINSIIQDGFLPLEEVIVIAKGLLTYNQDTAPALNGIIARMYRSITKVPMQQELLEAFLRNSVFVLDLPIPLAIDEAYYEQLHRQILAALIAA